MLLGYSVLSYGNLSIIYTFQLLWFSVFQVYNWSSWLNSKLTWWHNSLSYGFLLVLRWKIVLEWLNLLTLIGFFPPDFFFIRFFLNFILFNFTILYWFCHISKWICHRYTCVPHSEPSSILPPHTLFPVHQPQASSIVHQTWTGHSFHIWYYTYFNAILPNHPTLSLSHRVQKTVLCISVSFAVSYTGLLLPSF